MVVWEYISSLPLEKLSPWKLISVQAVENLKYKIQDKKVSHQISSNCFLVESSWKMAAL